MRDLIVVGLGKSLATYIKISFRVEDPFAYDQKYTEAFWRRLTVTSKNLKRN